MLPGQTNGWGSFISVCQALRSSPGKRAQEGEAGNQPRLTKHSSGHHRGYLPARDLQSPGSNAAPAVGSHRDPASSAWLLKEKMGVCGERAAKEGLKVDQEKNTIYLSIHLSSEVGQQRTWLQPLRLALGDAGKQEAASSLVISTKG